ncbi:hypothetical protein GCM10012286_39870 [Streptomyces lasiicapitis]|uniref:Uncharacterized protein n=1 Tax=Streptomyces lasiicapitis TaxID=1923961 RepID=A0ABQ2M5R9_9ACTN|nr:hypothetical protein GCM10012286_39870 [Streptomyces lasiicapitis]
MLGGPARHPGPLRDHRHGRPRPPVLGEAGHGRLKEPLPGDAAAVLLGRAIRLRLVEHVKNPSRDTFPGDGQRPRSAAGPGAPLCGGVEGPATSRG